MDRENEMVLQMIKYLVAEGLLKDDEAYESDADEEIRDAEEIQETPAAAVEAAPPLVREVAPENSLAHQEMAPESTDNALAPPETMDLDVTHGEQHAQKELVVDDAAAPKDTPVVAEFTEPAIEETRLATGEVVAAKQETPAEKQAETAKQDEMNAMQETSAEKQDATSKPKEPKAETPDLELPAAVVEEKKPVPL